MKRVKKYAQQYFKYIFSSSKHKNMQDLAWVFLHWVEKKSYLEEKLVELFGEVAIPFAFFFASVSCEGWNNFD